MGVRKHWVSVALGMGQHWFWDSTHGCTREQVVVGRVQATDYHPGLAETALFVYYEYVCVAALSQQVWQQSAPGMGLGEGEYVYLCVSMCVYMCVQEQGMCVSNRVE